MRVTLVGTASERLPRPGCRCRVCLVTTVAAAHAVVDTSPDSRPPGPDREVRLTTDDGPRVVSVGGAHLLWAPVDAPLSDDVLARVADLGSPLNAVVIGPTSTHPPEAAARDVARLRAHGLVTPSTALVLGGARHDHGVDGARLRLAMRAWGMTRVPDGTSLDLTPIDVTTAPTPAAESGGDVPPRLEPPRRTLVLGPAASGKSAVAEELLAAEPAVLYLATGATPETSGAVDVEWAQKVAAHRARRPSWWTTCESPDVAGVLAEADRPVLLDAIGTWLAGALDRVGAWDHGADRITPDGADWRTRLSIEVEALVQGWRQTPVPVVAVSEEVGWGVVPTTPAGRLFRDELGRLNARLAAESERVVLVVAGSPIALGGSQAASAADWTDTPWTT